MSFAIDSVRPRAARPEAVSQSKVVSLIDAFSRWRSGARAETELSSLSDRELKDIGLTRSEIPSAVRGFRSGAPF